MLFADGSLQSPDFWMGVVAGVMGTFILGALCLGHVAKKAGTTTDEEKEKERNTYWWNDGKKPNFNEDEE
jgi:hypothetical protein